MSEVSNQQPTEATMGPESQIDKPIIYLLCGLTGSGKTTYAEGLIHDGATKLSIDEEVFNEHGRYGVNYPEDQYTEKEVKAKKALEQKLKDLLTSGKSVVLDYGFWKKEDRDYYKKLIEENGGQWKLVYFKADNDELLERLKERNKRTDANALTVTKEMFLNDFVRRFEEPVGEGEEVIIKPKAP